MLRREKDGIQLAVIGYEYNEADGYNKWDDNWLVVKGNVLVEGMNISGISPCITTFELAELCKDLCKYKQGEVNEYEWNGTEINLSITIVNNVLTIFFCPNKMESEWSSIKSFSKKVVAEDLDALIKFCEKGIRKFPER